MPLTDAGLAALRESLRRFLAELPDEEVGHHFFVPSSESGEDRPATNRDEAELVIASLH